ncbi:MAG TPA: hypothetical protein VIP77_03180 [Jiangellaceae bacterium]
MKRTRTTALGALAVTVLAVAVLAAAAPATAVAPDAGAPDAGTADGTASNDGRPGTASISRPTAAASASWSRTPSLRSRTPC